MSHQLGPAAYVDLAVLGTVVRVHLDNPADREAVESPWELCLLPGDLEVPSERIVTLPATPDGPSRLVSLTTLTQDVTRSAIRAQSGRLLMFHAGALSNLESGATVAYVAPGGTGKTTIAKTLGAGRGYVTDETVGVTLDGAVVPYPKPLSVRRAGGGKDEVAPSRLGLQPPSADPWLAGLLVVRRDPEHAGPPIDRAVDLLDAITLLAPETSALAELPAPLRNCRDVIERVGGVRHVLYREAHQLDELVAEVLRRTRP